MANPEHLKLIKQGVEIWNQWREEHPNEKPDLRETDLEGADLRAVDLGGADLDGANLKEATLRKANLKAVGFRGANLEGAILRGAALTGVDFRETILNRADLRDADLRGAYLIQTNLREANITGALLYGTARDDWIIDDIKCDYVIWDLEGENRIPKDRDFRPGEFEKRYKHLPTVEGQQNSPIRVKIIPQLGSK